VQFRLRQAAVDLAIDVQAALMHVVIDEDGVLWGVMLEGVTAQPRGSLTHN